MWSALLILAVGDIVGTNLVNILFILVSASSTVAAPPTAAPDRRCRCSWASRHQSRCGQRTALSLTSMVELRDVRLTLLG
jgi:hypothetical protein